MKSSISIGNEEQNESTSDVPQYNENQENLNVSVSSDQDIKKQNKELDISIQLLNLKKEIESLKKENVTQKALITLIRNKTEQN